MNLHADLQRGESVAKGEASAVLGDPANSIAWLANKLASFGRRIEAGQPIMSGSLTIAFALTIGDQVETRFDPFGSVCVSVC